MIRFKKEITDCRVGKGKGKGIKKICENKAEKKVEKDIQKPRKINVNRKIEIYAMR